MFIQSGTIITIVPYNVTHNQSFSAINNNYSKHYLQKFKNNNKMASLLLPKTHYFQQAFQPTQCIPLAPKIRLTIVHVYKLLTYLLDPFLSLLMAYSSPLPCSVYMRVVYSMSLTDWLLHTHNCFTALRILSGTTPVSRYQKKHSPTHTYCGYQSSLIYFLHLLWSMASSLFNLLAWQSFSRISLQIFFALPVGLGPSTSYISSSNHCLLFAACTPYHRNLFCCSKVTDKGSVDSKDRVETYGWRQLHYLLC